eukprot:TRINITY_DN4367_c0_g1_i1.p1 TRINITY_DN4367_c0_g1~~TRINITY_DN4367_c0_g1_i1.p1  ORF type:complete len:342 (+),score=50.68 TRINITY_DN4367_c0_g1_i1:116-1141(+)
MYLPRGTIVSQVDHKEYPNFYDFWVFVPSFQDAILVFGWAIVLTFLRVYVQEYFKGVARRLKVKEEFKFSEASWKVLFYIISWTSGMWITLRLGLLSNTMSCWAGWPNIPLEWDTYQFYLFQLGFYWHSLYAHFVYEVKRKDFWPLLLHHVVTILLIYFSYVIGFHRIGVLVLVCHDINDIVFEYGKTLVYQKKEPHTTIVFVFIVLFWILSRLFTFPAFVIWSVFHELYIMPSDVFPFYLMFVGCLLFLLCLHIYWFGLMTQMAIKVATAGEEVVDTREDDENSGKEKVKRVKTPAERQKERRTSQIVTATMIFFSLTSYYLIARTQHPMTLFGMTPREL